MDAVLKLPGGITLPFDSTDPNRPADNALLEPALGLLRVMTRTKWKTLLDKENQVQGFELPATLDLNIEEKVTLRP